MRISTFDGQGLIKRKLGERWISEHLNITLQLRHVLKITDALPR